MNTGLTEHLPGEPLVSYRAALYRALPTGLYISFFRSFHSEGPELSPLPQATRYNKEHFLEFCGRLGGINEPVEKRLGTPKFVVNWEVWVAWEAQEK